MKMFNALLVTTSGETQRVKIKTLKQMQSLLGGDIELVRIAGLPSIYVNEDGITLGLPVNTKITFWLGTIAPLRQAIMGPALIVGPVDSEGNDTSLPEDEILRLEERFAIWK